MLFACSLTTRSARLGSALIGVFVSRKKLGRQPGHWRKLQRSAMAAQCDALSGYLQQQQQSDHGSNSERSTDSPLPGSEEDLSGPQPLPDPEWTEERFRVDRKKLEIMLLGKKNKETGNSLGLSKRSQWQGGCSGNGS